jgi:hypothetical protein
LLSGPCFSDCRSLPSVTFECDSGLFNVLRCAFPRCSVLSSISQGDS